MKLLLGLFLMAGVLPCVAADDDSTAKRELIRTLRPLDKNHNAAIDRDEMEAVRRAFAKQPGGPLAWLDKDGDRRLDDAEITAPVLPLPKGKEKAKTKPAPWDRNRDGKLDPDEASQLQASYAKKPKGPAKRYDLNQDGKLSNDELAALNPGFTATPHIASGVAEEIRKAIPLN